MRIKCEREKTTTSVQNPCPERYNKLATLLIFTHSFREDMCKIIFFTVYQEDNFKFLRKIVYLVNGRVLTQSIVQIIS